MRNGFVSFICGGIIGVGVTIAAMPAKVITRTVKTPGPERIVEVEKVVHAPADTAAIESRLRASEAEAAANLKGWQDAYAAWQSVQPHGPQRTTSGAQGSDVRSRLFQWRGR